MEIMNSEEEGMKRMKYVALTVALLLVVPLAVMAKDWSPIVSTDWLEKNLTNPKVKMLDIRKVEEYREGHVPGSINIFFGTWAIKKKDLQNELPADDDLVDVISSLGIANDSNVVIIGRSDSVPELAALTRVAWTLKYAGVEQISILDGAYNKWVADKKPVSKDAVKITSSNFKPNWNRGIMITRDQVMAAIKKATIVDNRMPDFFFGVSKLDFVAKAGHIPSAVNLPTPWMFTKEGTFKSASELEAMAAGVVGKDKPKEIIEYCDTGRLASVVWFVLVEVLDYKNIKVYDGSMEDWAKDPNAPVVKYSWQ
jgi:thiosulfate/3-mercaptopyruvate sulfurtransferase